MFHPFGAGPGACPRLPSFMLRGNCINKLKLLPYVGSKIYVILLYNIYFFENKRSFLYVYEFTNNWS
jgi:hypothetical protein